MIQSGKYAKPLESEGNLYNVELRWPDAAREAVDPLSEEHFLHWDKPLSEQSQFVKNAISPYVREYGLPMSEEGRSLYSVMKELEGKKIGLNSGSSPSAFNQLSPQASEALYQAGIPGIRYLDQGSRGAGQGTHNYVIFDENIPNIVSRNGVSLSDLLRR